MNRLPSRPDEGEKRALSQPSRDGDLCTYEGGTLPAKENRYTYQAVGTDLSVRKTMGYSVGSLVLGILSILLGATIFGSLILGPLSVVLAVISSRHLKYFDTMSILGLTLGIFGFLFGAVGLVLLCMGEYWPRLLFELGSSAPPTN